MRRAAVAVVLSMLLLVVGWATTGSVGAQAPGCLPTSDRTIGPHGFPGLAMRQRAPVYTDALRFVESWGLRPAAAQNEAEALNREGFVSGIQQLYKGKKQKTRGDEGLSIAWQLGSPEQAQAEFDRTLTYVRRLHGWKRFTVSAIPGSAGLRARYSDRSGSSNLYFTEGDYVYGVGRYVDRGGTGAGQVTKAAINLYNRVHGAAVCP